MSIVLPVLAFVLVFCAVLLLGDRTSPIAARLARHTIGSADAALPRSRGVPIRQRLMHGRLATMVVNSTKLEVKEQSARLLRQAGSTLPVTAFLLLRTLLLLVGVPLVAFVVLRSQGISLMGLGMVAVAALALPRLPTIVFQRRAKQRGAAIEKALPDALDLLVVCVEGGLSLDGGLLQVAQRTEGPVAEELRKLQRDMAAGVGRRDAFMSLADRSPSESLAVVCSTITQADKMGMSIGATLRALADTMRTRRRQSAEEKARKAPIKMMPVLILFMIPSMFIVILGSAVMAIMEIM